jgi:hypothetical protein
MKVNCIIDTCSCIYLSYAEFKQKTLLGYLHDTVNLNVSHEVHLEINDHKGLGLPVFIANRKLIVRPLKRNINEYERRMLGKVIPSRAKKGNKGEVDNFLVTVDQLHHVKKNGIVFISDDDTSHTGMLSDWISSFPLINVWTSFDVVLFLYAEKVIPSKDIALEMIKDLNYKLAPPKSERSAKTTEKLIKRLADFNKKVETASKLIN